MHPLSFHFNHCKYEGRMLTVHSPLSSLWHPIVHQSLLLLRLLGKKHTLKINEGYCHEKHNSLYLPTQACQLVSVSCDIISPDGIKSETVYEPDHVFLLPGCLPHSEWAEKLDLHAYLGASTVSRHIMSSVELFLSSMQGNDIELVRRCHAIVLRQLEKLESTLENESHNKCDSDKAPFSAAAIFPLLHFIIEEGDLLLSAFPTIAATYHECQNYKEIARHQRLINKSVEDFNRSTDVITYSPSHPLRGFLADVHGKISLYNTSFEESITQGVAGDGGPLKSRVSGGRFGVQSAPTRLPWTRQNSPLSKQRVA